MEHNTWDVTVPSGKKWTIREINGEDEGVLSTLGTAMNGTNVNNFIASIIVGPNKVSAKDILDWPCNDKYYLIFKQRLLNHGPDFVWKHTDPEDELKREIPYDENLSSIDGDLSDPSYKPGPNQIFLYPMGNKSEIEFSIASGKKFKYKILTGLLETMSTSMAQAENNRNTALLVREIEQFNPTNSKWERLYNFAKLTAKEMAEIRRNINTNDRPFDPVISFKNPYTGNPVSAPLLALPNFFFPEETT